MGIALIPLGLVLTCLGIFGWLRLCAWFDLGGWRGFAGALTLQLSAVCLVYGFVRGQPLASLFMAAFPPLAVVELVGLNRWAGLLVALAWGVGPDDLAARVSLPCASGALDWL